MSPVEDQSQCNSCCANAVAGAFEYLNMRHCKENGDTPADISRLFIYYVGRKRDQETFFEKARGSNWARGCISEQEGEDASSKVESRDSLLSDVFFGFFEGSCSMKLPEWDKPSQGPLCDEGMTIGGAITAMQTHGACMESEWPYDLKGVNKKPTEDWGLKETAKATTKTVPHHMCVRLAVHESLSRFLKCIPHFQEVLRMYFLICFLYAHVCTSAVIKTKNIFICMRPRLRFLTERLRAWGLICSTE